MSELCQYDYVRFTVADIHGRSRGRVVPVRHAQKGIESGVSLYGGTLFFSLNNTPVPVNKNDPDCEHSPQAKLKPDMNTIYSASWCGGGKFRVAEVICESYWLKDQTHQQACPRYVARQQLRRLADHGLEILSSFEMEFKLQRKGIPMSSEPSYMSQREQAKHSEFLFEVEHCMDRAGVGIESFHSEYDAGIFEVVLKPSKGMDAADIGFKFKTGIQEIADKYDYDVSFKSKQDNADIGMHFNHSLWSVSENTNVFSCKDTGLSETGQHWLAGLLKHAKAMTALYSPTVNCYERLHQPLRPGVIFWEYDDRSACVRTKVTDTDRGMYLENRIPSGMRNPYLVLATIVAAGLDGIVNKLDCPPSREKLSDNRLPFTLSEALQDLSADTEMSECLGAEFIAWFTETLRCDIRCSVSC